MNRICLSLSEEKITVFEYTRYDYIYSSEINDSTKMSYCVYDNSSNRVYYNSDTSMNVYVDDYVPLCDVSETGNHLVFFFDHFPIFTISIIVVRTIKIVFAIHFCDRNCYFLLRFLSTIIEPFLLFFLFRGMFMCLGLYASLSLSSTECVYLSRNL